MTPRPTSQPPFEAQLLEHRADAGTFFLVRERVHVERSLPVDGVREAEDVAGECALLASGGGGPHPLLRQLLGEPPRNGGRQAAGGGGRDLRGRKGYVRILVLTLRFTTGLVGGMQPACEQPSLSSLVAGGRRGSGFALLMRFGKQGELPQRRLH